MVIVLMDENGEQLVELDELKLFGELRECDEETGKVKYREESDEGQSDNQSKELA